jgi:hypothetical protein
MTTTELNVCESVKFVSGDILRLAENEQVPTQLELALWNWLANPYASSLDLLQAIRTGELQSRSFTGGVNAECNSAWFRGYRDESPHLWLLRCLPAAANITRPDFVRVLASRLGGLFRHIAENSELRGELVVANWSDLFDFAHRICITSELFDGVMRLQEAFDNDRRLPYPFDHACADNFTRLIGRVQPDNRYCDRWSRLLDLEDQHRASVDPTFPAEWLTAWQSLCLLPEPAPFDVFEQCAERLCRRLSNSYKNPAVLTRLGKSIATVPALCNSSHRSLVLARLWNDYQWLPVPDPLVFAIAVVRDFGFLGQITVALQSVNSGILSLAEAMYQVLVSKEQLCISFQDFLSRNAPNVLGAQKDLAVSHSDLECGKELFLQMTITLTPEITDAFARLKKKITAHSEIASSNVEVDEFTEDMGKLIAGSLAEPMKVIMLLYTNRAFRPSEVSKLAI